MDNNKINELVMSVIANYLESQGIDLNPDQHITLFGDDALIDSMGLVNIVIDLESEFLDKGFEISLTSNKAMSRIKSPFRTVETLVDFISEQINE